MDIISEATEELIQLYQRQDELQAESISLLGGDAQLDQLVQELSELIHVILKYKQHQVFKTMHEDKDLIKRIHEEKVDVRTCLGYLDILFPIDDDVEDEILNYKLDRLEKRLKKLRESTEAL